MSDMEGVSGIVVWDQVNGGADMYEEGRKLYTEEINAAVRGAKSAGGTTIGILPGNDPADANRWVDFPICTGLGYARNVIVVKSGRAVIAIDGAFGTLSELGHALGDGIPVVGLNTWSLARNGQADESMLQASTPLEAVERAMEVAKQRAKRSSYKSNLTSP